MDNCIENGAKIKKVIGNWMLFFVGLERRKWEVGGWLGEALGAEDGGGRKPFLGWRKATLA